MTDNPIETAAERIVESSSALDEAFCFADESAGYYEPLVGMARAMAATNEAATQLLNAVRQLAAALDGDEL